MLADDEGAELPGPRLAVTVEADTASSCEHFLAKRDAESALHEFPRRFHKELDDLQDRQLEGESRIHHFAPRGMTAPRGDEGLHGSIEGNDPPVLTDDDARS